MHRPWMVTTLCIITIVLFIVWSFVIIWLFVLVVCHLSFVVQLFSCSEVHHIDVVVVAEQMWWKHRKSW